jgi:hypothetical protein
MQTATNKELMQSIFAELEKGNAKPLYESFADDVRWTITGSTPWSKTYDGKAAVRELLAALGAQFADRYRATARRFIAEGDYVVVEYEGAVTTKAGKPYHNTYCLVYRLAGGKIRELTEYSDTALIASVLSDPPV